MRWTPHFVWCYNHFALNDLWASEEQTKKPSAFLLFNGYNAHQRGCMAPWDLPTTQQEPEKTIWKAEYSQKMDTPTVMTIRGHSRGAAAHTALLQEEKQGTAVCWANGPNTGSLSGEDAWFMLMKTGNWEKLLWVLLHFNHFSESHLGPVKIFIYLSGLCVNHQPRQILYNIMLGQTPRMGMCGLKPPSIE